jgi:hypothetical protein
MPVGASNRLYPRELVLVGTGLQNQRGGSFGSLVGGGFNDVVGAFSFQGYPATAPNERQYAAFYLSSSAGQITGMVAGNVTTNVGNMIVTNTGPVGGSYEGTLPGTAGEPGALRGWVSDTLAFTDLDGLIWQAGVTIDFNVPIIWDE